MRICLRDVPGTPGSVADAVAAVAALGFDGLHLPSVPTPDSGALADLAAVAAAHGVGLTVGTAGFLAHPPERATELLAAGDGDVARGLERTLAAAAVLGTRELAVVLGPERDRFDPVLPWAERLRATTRLYRELAGVLRAAGARLVVKTHEEVTSVEVARLVDDVGADVVAVAFDPVNVLVRLEDPVVAAQRLAGAVAAVHVDDACFGRTARGVVRRAAVLGAGVLDWPALREALPGLPLVLDLHRAELDMPTTDPDWRAAQPDAGPADLARVEGLAGPDRPGPDLAERQAGAFAALRAWGALPVVAR